MVRIYRSLVKPTLTHKYFQGIKICNDHVVHYMGYIEVVLSITVGPTIITLHELIVPGLIIELHYICSVCLN